MTDQPSRLAILQTLCQVHREYQEALAAAAGTDDHESVGQLWERYSYGQLQIIADFLTSDVQRLRRECAVDARLSD